MDVDRKTVVQVVVSVVAVAIFISGLIAITGAYGSTVVIGPDDDEGQLDGTLNGEFDDDFEIEADGTVSSGFVGEFENDIIATLDGPVEGSVDDGVFTGELDGTIVGAIDGNVTGEMNGTVDDDGSFEGTFQGTAEGETQQALSPDGGLLVLGLIVAYIVLLPLLGYFIERYDFEEE